MSLCLLYSNSHFVCTFIDTLQRVRMSSTLSLWIPYIYWKIKWIFMNTAWIGRRTHTHTPTHTHTHTHAHTHCQFVCHTWLTHAAHDYISGIGATYESCHVWTSHVWYEWVMFYKFRGERDVGACRKDPASLVLLVCCNKLQYSASHCNTLIHAAATRCSTLQDTAARHCNTLLEHTAATHCNIMLQYTATKVHACLALLVSAHTNKHILVYVNWHYWL